MASVTVDNPTFDELSGEQQLAVLVLRALAAGYDPERIRNIVERVIEVDADVDSELAPPPAPKLTLVVNNA